MLHGSTTRHENVPCTKEGRRYDVCDDQSSWLLMGWQMGLVGGNLRKDANKWVRFAKNMVWRGRRLAWGGSLGDGREGVCRRGTIGAGSCGGVGWWLADVAKTGW